MTTYVNIHAQGEVNCFLMDGELPQNLQKFGDVDHKGRPILSHSEKGHHHVLDLPGIEVLEDPNPPEGLNILYAILENPTALIQDAPDAHEPVTLPKGNYKFVISREFDPLTSQSRRVAD